MSTRAIIFSRSVCPRREAGPRAKRPPGRVPAPANNSTLLHICARAPRVAPAASARERACTARGRLTLGLLLLLNDSLRRSGRDRLLVLVIESGKALQERDEKRVRSGEGLSPHEGFVDSSTQGTRPRATTYIHLGFPSKQQRKHTKIETAQASNLEQTATVLESLAGRATARRGGADAAALSRRRLCATGRCCCCSRRSGGHARTIVRRPPVSSPAALLLPPCRLELGLPSSLAVKHSTTRVPSCARPSPRPTAVRVTRPGSPLSLSPICAFSSPRS